MKIPFLIKSQSIKTKNELDDNNFDIKNSILLFLCIIIFWFFCGIGFFFIRKLWVNSISKDDVFEAINSLFSGLAFAGLIYTIMLQRKELSLQRKELRDTRDVFQEQSSLMKFQQKVNVFFQMIENHRGVVKSLNTTTKTHKHIPESARSEEIETKREGYEVIEDKINQLNSTLITSSSIHINKEGNLNYFSQRHPSIIKYKYKDLENIYTSLKMIIEFIVTQLDNDIIYHKIFYNAISRNEKIIIGIYSNFFEKKENQIISTSDFSYLEEYNQVGYKTIIGLKLPYLNLILETSKVYLTSNITSAEMPKLVLTNHSQHPIKLNEITINKIGRTTSTYPVDNYSQQEELLKIRLDLSASLNNIVNIPLEEILLNYLFNEEYFDIIKKEDLKSMSTYIREKNSLNLILNIEYDKEIYNIHTTLKFQINSYDVNKQILFSIH